jgi:hypothetical protein
METHTDIVADPVGHISISGVHGRKELDERLSNARVQGVATGGGFGKLVAAALIGAAIMYVLHPARRRPQSRM